MPSNAAVRAASCQSFGKAPDKRLRRARQTDKASNGTDRYFTEVPFVSWPLGRARRSAGSSQVPLMSAWSRRPVPPLLRPGLRLGLWVSSPVQAQEWHPPQLDAPSVYATWLSSRKENVQHATIYGLDVHTTSCTFCVVGPSGRRLQTTVVETNGSFAPRPSRACNGSSSPLRGRRRSAGARSTSAFGAKTTGATRVGAGRTTAASSSPNARPGTS